MIKALLLFFCPSKLILIAVSNGQDESNASESVQKIRSSYFKAIATITFLCIISVVVAYIINQIGGLKFVQLTAMRFFCFALIALAVLAKLSWEIQTWKGQTIPEEVNSFLFKLFYKVGVIGTLASLLIKSS
jgi:hypothetical protein